MTPDGTVFQLSKSMLQDLTRTDAVAVVTFGDYNMNCAKAARECYMARTTIVYHLNKVYRITRLDPFVFEDLIKLYPVMKQLRDQLNDEEEEVLPR